MSDEVEEALEAYRRDQDVRAPLTAIAQAAFREFLTGRGYLISRRALQFTPAERESGKHDISEKHGRYLTEQ